MKNIELTQAELQLLVKLLKVEIGFAQSYVIYDKNKCAILYELCDSDEPSTELDFDRLNYHKDRLRYWKNQNKKLSTIQAKLKRAR